MHISSVLSEKRKTFVISILLAALIGILVVFSQLRFSQANRNSIDRFEHLFVDHNGLHDPWGKSVDDINGDGMPDIVVGAQSLGNGRCGSIY